MSVYQFDPLRDPRWHEFLQRDNRASIFHTAGWLEALQRSYGYEPTVFTTSNEREPLANAMVVCRVNSWLTGRRLVSLPFSDHCEPLVEGAGDLEQIMLALRDEVQRGQLKYVEIRPVSSLRQGDVAFSQSSEFCLHSVDLRPRVVEIYQKLHKDSIRRKIVRANREGLLYEKGTSRDLLEKFYQLFVVTRARHGLPPSPFLWFSNLVECLGERLQVRIASKQGKPVAGIITLTYKNSIVYKYGASDVGFNNLGGMPFLLWKAILEAKSEGLEKLDLGRSDNDDDGLITFKDRWGSVRSDLTYWRWPTSSHKDSLDTQRQRIAKSVLGFVPNLVRVEVGNFFCRHLG